MWRRLWLAMALAVSASTLLVPVIAPHAEACEGQTNLLYAAGSCEISGDEAVSMSQSGDGHVYTLRIDCDAFSEDINRCKSFSTCGTDPLKYRYTLLRDGEPIGEVCLDPDQAGQLGEITPGLVLREFKSLEWPSAELVIQPVGNETLVNFKTLFHTTLAEPATQTITLLGHEVVIEATPETYVWHSDQGGAETWETNDPGRPIEDGDDPAEMNHYIYETKGSVRPSVDVIYSGRYRVDGGGWQGIPDTLTVSGEPVDLSVLEATPVLTGGY